MPLSGEQFSISAGAHAATIAAVGAGLRTYTVDGADVTCSYAADALAPKCCGTTLVPWPNRIRQGRYVFDGDELQLALTEPAAGNAIHGLGRWARWSPVSHTESAVTLRLDVVPQNGYPFDVQVDVTYALDADTGLRVTPEARNTGSTAAPFGAGAHPYLSTRGHRLDDVVVRLPAREQFVVDDAQIPTGVQPVEGTEYDLRSGRELGTLRMDAGFTGLEFVDGLGTAELRAPDGGARLWFEPDFGYLQVFTRENLTPGQHGVAIEPMTCAPDAFNSRDGLIVLGPGQEWSASWGITPT
ncbi:aldose 1-epimerase family protein [uncultured Jatrophihabitans sp.]|uniref:aldose 1-epimerase family protein n=1 Tax=uncultured Jatrophihabitans sp. TaxID=1610747 RepID=UPI0035CC76BF